MKRLVRKSVVFLSPLVVLTLFPAAAWTGQDDHLSAKQRRETFEASRNAEEQARVKPNKALLKAIEQLKQAWKAPGGNLPPIAPAAECVPGWSYGDSPGLVTRSGAYGPGASEPTYYDAWQYDRHGNVTYSSRGLGRPNWSTDECAYDDRGDLHLGKLVYKKSNSSYWPGPVYHVTYNDRDQVDIETEENLKRDGTLDHRQFNRYVYDGAGRLLEQNFEVDANLDGTIDYQSAIVISYNEQGHYTRMVLGYYDVPGGVFTPYRTDEYTREADTEYRDYDGDGVADQWSKLWYSYDEQNRVIRVLHEFDDYGRSDGGADGIVDERRLQQYEYDTAGNLVRETYETFGPEPWPFREESLYTYNDRGWLMKQVNNDDEFIDGVNDFVDTWTFSRNERGKMTETLAVSSNSYSTHKQSERVVLVYDGIGNVLETMSTGWSNDDPPPPLSRRLAFEYAAGRSGQQRSGKD